MTICDAESVFVTGRCYVPPDQWNNVVAGSGMDVAMSIQLSGRKQCDCRLNPDMRWGIHLQKRLHDCKAQGAQFARLKTATPSEMSLDAEENLNAHKGKSREAELP